MNLSQEDIEFLKELQHKLKTQETDYQAAPRFWGVMETKRIYGFSDDYSDGIYIRDCDIDEFCYEDDELDDALEFLTENEYVNEDDISHVTNLYDLKEILEDLGHTVEIYGYKELDVLSEETGCFLTKEACKKHIELNHYHYDKPRTYAMTAFRNPEFGRLMKIIENIEFEEK